MNILTAILNLRFELLLGVDGDRDLTGVGVHMVMIEQLLESLRVELSYYVKNLLEGLI